MPIVDPFLRDILSAALEADADGIPLLDELDVGLIAIDPDLRYRYINRTARESSPVMSSRPEGQLVDEVLRGYYPGHIVDGLIATFRQVLATGEPYRSPQWSVSERFKDMQDRWLDWRVHCVRDRDGKPAGLLVIFTDVTDHVRSYQRLQDQERHLALIIDHVPAMIGYVDVDERVVQANLAYERNFGRPRDALVDGSLQNLLGEAVYEEFRDDLRRVFGGEEISWEREITLPDQPPRIMEGVLVPDRDAKGQIRGYVSLAQDVTERRQNEAMIARMAEQLKRQTAELERSNAELSGFAGMIAHDLKEPSRQIASYGSLVQQRYASGFDEQGRCFIDRVVRGATRMSTMVDNLLRYARVDQARAGFERFQLMDALAEAMAILGERIKECGAKIAFDDLPEVIGDPSLLTHLFQNLLENALKYCEGPPEVRITVQDQGRHWLLTMADTGIGIPEGDLERIFSMFHRANATADRGMGIGLATCRKIVELHGGRIWAESAIGVGTSIFFSLSKDG